MIAGNADDNPTNTSAIQASKTTENQSYQNEKAVIDLLVRRQKNRERQRRYRARKHLEAEMKRSHMLEHNRLLSAESQLNGAGFKLLLHEVDQQGRVEIPRFVERVHCRRKWKKDARLKHASKHIEQIASVSSVKASVQVETKVGGFRLGRRDWKADARKKTLR